MVTQNFDYIYRQLTQQTVEDKKAFLVDFTNKNELRTILVDNGFMSSEQLPAEINVVQTLGNFFNAITHPTVLDVMHQEDLLVP